ncbi:hypothetical protein TNCV_5013531 [Trichonephila clavipes]|nr:hypothetical protein TNCV_5013531 [Trichonephila clavipes]
MKLGGKDPDNHSSGQLPRPSSASRQTTRGLLETDLIILNHGQLTRTTPELAPSLLTTIPYRGRMSTRRI